MADKKTSEKAQNPFEYDISDRTEKTRPPQEYYESIKAKFAEERDLRLDYRADGSELYVSDLDGDLAKYAVDPYASEPEQREPLNDTVEVLFIGGGFSALLTSARLREVGVESIRIVERGADVGGTWYWNRYPGVACDVVAYDYLPLLDEMGYVPSRHYAPGEEILDHCRAIADRYDLYDLAVFQTTVTSTIWDEENEVWHVSTDRGDEITAKFVVCANGTLSKPRLAKIDGIEAFEGVSFHTSRWNYDFTGPNLENLADKRVGIIGTGASAVQAVPFLGAAAKELFVFQRTPSSIDVRNNRPTDPEWFATLQPGWQREWLENFTTLQTGGFTEEDLVMDGWTDISKRIRAKAMADPDHDFSPEALQRAYHESDDEKMEEIRARVDEIVDDPATAEALKPWYRQLCKRPCFHDEYLDAYNTSSTHLIDTDGRGVEEINATGVVVNGRQYDLDCLIYASGFEVGTDFHRRSGFDMEGRRGERLSAHWSDGMLTLHGIQVHGFPNAFIIGPTQAANLISNIPHNLTEAGETVAAIVAHALEANAQEVEATAEAEAAWVAMLETGGRSFGGDPTCTPGYYNNEGRERDRRGLRNSMGYPDGPVAYFDYIDRWRTSGDFEGVTFS